MAEVQLPLVALPQRGQRSGSAKRVPHHGHAVRSVTGDMLDPLPDLPHAVLLS